ncbi:MAG: hypothetical protein DI533_07175 [Cereibacter sphaeroides]|uniref:Uncharacterized protein n=1 Tax=Cereibacter sphaeroides TaxID=1063 RepID=A0A2W5SDV3_CERSP|nr:MAG: hypothetical protein DI533_07175 [Cereibacter sphaeroides]
MAEVMMTVNHQRPVGAFMTALTRWKDDDRPETVEDFMKLLAGYLNRNFLKAQNPVDVSAKAPDLVKQDAKEPGEAVAAFVPYDDDDKSDKAMGRWTVHPYMEIANVRKNAALELHQHSASRVFVRLPETKLLKDAERDAHVLSVAGDKDKFTGPTYYYNYFGQTADMTTMEYLWSRIADYTTSSCR